VVVVVVVVLVWLWLLLLLLLLLVVAIFNITTYPIPQLSSLPPCLFYLNPIDIHKNHCRYLMLLESTSFYDFWKTTINIIHTLSIVRTITPEKEKHKHITATQAKQNNRALHDINAASASYPFSYNHNLYTNQTKGMEMPASLYLSPLETAIRHGKIQ